MKITVESKRVEKPACKHEVGGVYRLSSTYYLVANSAFGEKFIFIRLNDCKVISVEYKSLAEMDKDNPNDIPVDAELVVREVE